MSEMEERVARAIHEALEPWDAFEIDRAEWVKAARAAVQSMREPTHEMTGAVLQPCADRTELVRDWRDMIDSILEQNPPSPEIGRASCRERV